MRFVGERVAAAVQDNVAACGKLSTIYQDLILILQSAKILKYFQNFQKYQNTFFNLKQQNIGCIDAKFNG